MQQDTIHRTVLCGAVVALVVGSAALAAVDAPPQSRVDEIAAMLDERPSGLGRPCADRRAWDGLARHKPFQAVVTAAEHLLDDPIPEQPDELYLDYSRTGNRKPWERVAHARRGRIKTLVVAECVENDGRFLPAFEQLVRALCAEPTWVYPAHDPTLGNFRGERVDIDLGSSYVAGELALARYVLGDKLGKETRALIDAKVRARVLDPFREMALGRREANWWLECTNNWNSVCLAGVSTAALSLVEDPTERAFYIAAAEQYSKNFLRGFTADGYCSEGLGYWNYGFGRYALLAEAIDQATHGGLNLMSVDASRLPAQFGSRVEIIGGVYPTFADCPMNTKPDRTLVTYVNRRLKLGRRAGEHERADPRRGSLAQTLAFTDWSGAPRSARKPHVSADPALRTWFEEAGVLICRPAGGKPGRLGVAIKGGHNAEHHNHNDVGSFIVVAGDRPVLADPGTEVYTARTFSSRRYESKVLNSFGHPVPVVAGALQRCGADARGRVLKADFTDARDTLVLDLHAAYAAETLQRLEREFTFERGDVERLVVTDTIELSQPASFEVALVTFGTWRQVTPHLLRVDDQGRAVDVELLTEGLEVAVTAEQIDENVRTKRKPTRIAIRTVQPVRAARLTMRISPVIAAAKP
ncbi:MAG: heparinase II/III family protein [Phycisphaerales bacterium]|nr:MAG: heparinase II/III family protein [Phycisphaerales bacterium]